MVISFKSFKLAVILCLLLATRWTISQATLTLTHGIVYPGPRVVTSNVVGVAALDLGTADQFHYFDCETTAGTFRDLLWERESVTIRFPAFDFNGRLRLNMAPDNEEPVGYSDLDIYTCRNTVTSERISINITGGTIAVCPVQPIKRIALSENATLSIYVAGIPAIEPNEIHWISPNGSNITSEGRYILMSNNTRLFIQGVHVSDGGRYRVDVIRQVPHIMASTFIELDIYVHPILVSGPTEKLALEHEHITLECTFDGNPLPNIEWEREGGQTLPVLTRRRIASTAALENNTVTSELVIHRVFYEDRGSYRCRATNTDVEGVQRTAASNFSELTVMPALFLEAASPDIIDDNRHVRTNSGSSVQIGCSGSGALSWSTSSGVHISVERALQPTNSLYQTSDPSNNLQTLFIQNFSHSDVARYTCRTNLTADGMSIAESVFITNSDNVPYIAETNIYVNQGSNVQIRATVYAQSTPVIQWYYRGEIINTSLNSCYSIGLEQNGVHFLNISDVNTDVLGPYEVVAFTDTGNESDSVQLKLLESPTVSPSSASLVESEGAQFRCVPSSSEIAVAWQREGGRSLPNGVTQEGDSLVISSATRHHTGTYKCIARSNSGSTTSAITMLRVLHVPLVNIAQEGSGKNSTDSFLEMVVESGDTVPTFSCFSDGFPAPTLTWRKDNGSLPKGINVNELSSNLSNLEWTRNVAYTDSGQYQCIAQNKIGTSVAVLTLLIQWTPSVTSIFANSLSITSTSSSFLIPAGYTGTVLTCAGYGWPTPNIQWLYNNEIVSGRAVSVRTSNSPFVSARLTWVTGFTSSDTGNYTCLIGANGTTLLYSQSVHLQSSSVPASSSKSKCSVGLSQAYFIIRVLDTDCLMWKPELKGTIAENFRNKLTNVISVQCPGCMISRNDIDILGIPTCSNQIKNAMNLKGSITVENATRRSDILCALKMWQENGPLIVLMNELHLVDISCPLASSLSSSECASPAENTSAIIAGVSAGAGILAILSTTIIILILSRYITKNRATPH